MSSPNAPAGIPETPLSWQGRDFTLVLDWRAIAWFEREADASLIELYAGLTTGRPKLSLLAFFLLAMLQRHHADVSLDEAGEMAMDDDVRRQLDLAAAASMPPVDPGSAANGSSGGKAKKGKAPG